jgi:hypothetical protein
LLLLGLKKASPRGALTQIKIQQMTGRRFPPPWSVVSCATVADRRWHTSIMGSAGAGERRRPVQTKVATHVLCPEQKNNIKNTRLNIAAEVLRKA